MATRSECLLIQQVRASTATKKRQPPKMTIREACSIFLDQEARIRNLREVTIKGYQTVLWSLSRWADTNGLSALEDLEENAVRAWVGSWSCRPSTARQRLVQLKSFFRFTAESGWAARALLSRLRLPKNDSVPTMPLTASEVQALLSASEDQPRERALILLMRYSGLAIGDAVTLRRAAVADTELTLRRAKSGELVTVDLPDAVVRAMESISGSNPDYFWWSGTGKPVTAYEVLESAPRSHRRSGWGVGIPSAPVAGHVRGVAAGPGRRDGGREHVARPSLHTDYGAVLRSLG